MSKYKIAGAELLVRAVNQIIAHPETWNQARWHCRSQHCIAGWCELLATGKESLHTKTVAARALGIVEHEARWLFNVYRSLPEIRRYALDFAGLGVPDKDWNHEDILDSEGYNEDGFDYYGTSRDGERLALIEIPGVRLGDDRVSTKGEN